jgi:FMN phosphatase YigB (HAD superfamily)
VDEVDELTREVVVEEPVWARFARQHRLGAADLKYLRERMAEKFTKNLNVWKELPGWGSAYRLAVLHGGPADLLERLAAAHGLSGLVADHIIAGALGYPRDDPALYARIAADAGLSLEQCLLVDDEREPVLAAHEAGMGAYRFGTVYGLNAVLADPSQAFVQ